MTSVDIALQSGTVLKHLDESSIHGNLKSRGFTDDVALKEVERSDLTTHIYEGGLKVWECSLDLCNLIEEHTDLFVGKHVLELGCGAGLPGILAARCHAAYVTLQDFNECVVRCFTSDNLALNDVSQQSIGLISGGWNELPRKIDKMSYDIILTAETIYNEGDYESLHDALDFALSPSGFCWLAAKFFYFGVGGSVPTFIQYVESRRVFTLEEKMSVNTGVPRRILELRRITC